MTISAALALLGGLALVFVGRPLLGAAAACAAMLAAWAVSGPASWAAFGAVALVFAALVVTFAIPPLRRRLVTRHVLPRLARMLPRLGETERTALEAGGVGWDGELFSGAPDWKRLLAEERGELGAREQAFLDGPVEALCARLDEWDVTQSGDLPDDVWQRLRDERFFGLVIPERYGGLGFSARGHAAVVEKLASRSVTAAVTAMVPNSLGPAELLLAYGTEEQREHWLPRLARGEEIPCFALTGPEAGSDAAATQSEGVVCRGKWRSDEVLGIRLRWSKRYITLAPVATLIGLAFRLRDPDHLIGEREDLGITCALVPADLPGIEIGDRHDPNGVPFQNGPIEGDDVFVPIDAIIGGVEGAGRGWKMLMECLAAGRAISLPSVSVAGAKLAARVTSAYAMVREQFDTPIGRFEGVEEPLARIAGLTYATTAARSLALEGVDAGEKPAVPSAIVKCYCTESLRRIANDAMDIRAGAAIMRGPRNVLGRLYATVPIAITVEGANILTRSMIIYGQGAIRSHPFVLAEMSASRDGDLAAFDRAFFGHVGFVATTALRAFALGLTGGRLQRGHSPHPLVRRGCRRLGRASAAFALVSDLSMASLGGELKRREKLTGRLADALAWLYIGSAVVQRFAQDGAKERDRALARWALDHALSEVDAALDGVLRNLPSRALARAARVLVFPLGRRERGPDDAAGTACARALLDDPDAREHLTAGIHLPRGDEPGLGRLESALRDARAALAVEAKLRRAVAEGRIEHAPGRELAERARAAGCIGDDELAALTAADRARDEAIRVDAFAPGAYAELRR
ncbi:MAG: acyl-CoA dehydrogenase [Myxococcota bacterium]